MTPTPTIKAIAQIVLLALPYLLDWVDSYLKARKRREREEQRNALRENPGAWAADHFDGKLRDLDASGKVPRTNPTSQAKD